MKDFLRNFKVFRPHSLVWKTAFVVFLLGMLHFIDLQGQTIRYVTITGAGTMNGSSWADASNDPQAMLNASTVGDAVWVAVGTYKPTAYPMGCTGCATDRDFTFYVPDGVNFYGGFAGTETSLNQRLITINVTTLSGDIGSVGNATDNAYHVLIATAPSTGGIGVTVNGFSITGGNSSTLILGGITMMNGIFVGRVYGGGIFTSYGNNTIANNIIYNNSTYEGGGIFTTNGTNTLTNNIIYSNFTHDGGGIFINFGRSIMKNNIIYNNTASSWGGGIATNQSAVDTLVNNTIYNNTAAFGGGGIYIVGGKNIIRNNIFWENKWGGNANVQGSDYLDNSTLTRNTFIHNLLQLTASNYTTTGSGSYDIGIGAAGNIFAQSPLFINPVDPDGTDNIYRTADDGLHLNCSSPAINTGNNTGVASTDITGAPRIQQTIVDMGAYENASEIVGNLTATPTTCGQCNGSITCNPTGGTPPYSFIWSNTETTQNLTDLCAGTYTMTITDANGCMATQTVVIFSSAPISVIISNMSNGCDFYLLTAHVSGGTAPYAYTWNDGSPWQAISINDAGTYTVTVTDAMGCTATASIVQTTILAPPQANLSTTNTTCGQCNGSITSNPTGGAPPYTYNWSDDPTQDPIRNDLCAGTYTVTITDVNGCTGTETVIISSSSCNIVPQFTIEQCCGSKMVCFDDLSSVSGGSGEYTYHWYYGGVISNGCNSLVWWEAHDHCITYQENGIYNVCLEIYDAITGCCNNIVCHTVVVDDAITNMVLDMPIMGNANDISGNNNHGTVVGATLVADRNGNANSAYFFDGVNDQINIADNPTLDLTDTYTIMAWVKPEPGYGDFKDNHVALISKWGNGGPNNAAYALDIWTGGKLFSGVHHGGVGGTFLISNGVVPTSVWTHVAVTRSCDDSLRLYINGVLDKTQYSVIPQNSTFPLTIGMEADPGIQAAYPTNYRYHGAIDEIKIYKCGLSLELIRTNAGIECATSVTLTTINNPTCGQCNGSLTATVSDGTPPYSFAWPYWFGSGNNTGANTNTITGLCYEMYTVTVTDGMGCTATATITLEPSTATAPQANLTTTNTTCGECNGSIAANPIGGTPPYTYNWSDDPASQDPIRNDLCAGTYTVTITDANGCTATASTNVAASSPPVVTITGPSTICAGECDTITASVSSVGATYQWSGDNNVFDDTPSIIVCPTPPVFGLAPIYTVTVTDANGCTATASIMVNVNPTPQANLTTTNTTCGQCDGSITSNPTGGTPPYTYNWSDNPASQDPIRNDLCAGTYTVTITDANGCTAVETAVVLPSAPPPQVNLMAIPTICGECNGSIVAIVNSGTPPYTYNWSDDPASQDPIRNGLCAGTYTVTITDANGCTGTSIATVMPSNPCVVECPEFCFETYVWTDANGNLAASVCVDLQGTEPITISWGDSFVETFGGGAFCTTGHYYGNNQSRQICITQGNCTTCQNVPDACGRILNHSFELTETAPPSAADQIDQAYAWHKSNSSNITSIADWYGGTFPYIGYYYPGPIVSSPPPIMTPHTGCHYAGFDLNTCEAFETTLTNPIKANCEVTVSFWWSPREFTTSNYSFTAVLGGAPCTAYAGSGCGHYCNGDKHSVVNVTPAHIPGTWYLHTETFTLTTMSINNLAFQANINVPTHYNHYIYIDDVCVEPTPAPCEIQAVLDIPNVCFNVNEPIGFCNDDAYIVGCDTEPIGITWNFGDGAVVTQALPTYSCPLHTYTTPGIYNVCLTVSGTNGVDTCSNTVCKSISVNLPFAATEQTITLCAGESTLLLPPYPWTLYATYEWFINGDSLGMSVDAGLTISPTTNTNYMVNVYDINECLIGQTAYHVVVHAASAIAYSNSPVCPGGTINLFAVGGASYSWSGPGGYTSTNQNPSRNNATAAQAGVYTVTVTNAAGCTATASTTVIVNAAPIASISGPSSFCIGTGIILTASGGGTYLWSNGGGTTNTKGVTASGTYTVTVTNAAGCTATASKTVMAQYCDTCGDCPVGAVNISTGINNATGAALPQGSPDDTWTLVSGPAGANLVANPNPAWANQMNNKSYWLGYGTGVGVYVYTHTITVPPCMTAQLCISWLGADDDINFSIDGNTVYSHATSAFTNANAYRNPPINVTLLPGTHILRANINNIQSAGGFLLQGCYVLTPNLPLSVSLQSSVTQCSSPCNGSINTTLTNGTPPYSFAWSNTATTQNLTGLCPGTYRVTVTDIYGCTATAQKQVRCCSPILADILPVSPILTGPFSYQAQSINITGTPPYAFSWDNEGYVRYDILYTELGATITIFSVTSAIWAVTVSNDCSWIPLSSNPSIDPPLHIVTTNIVPATTTLGGAINIDVAGGVCNSSYTYQWSGPNNFSATTQDITGLSFGWYSVTVMCGSESEVGWYFVPRARRGRAKTTDDIHGVASDSLSITARPNPAQSTVTFSYSLPSSVQDAELYISDLSGKVVIQSSLTVVENGILELNIANLTESMYFYQIKTESEYSIPQKLLVIN